MRRPQPPAWLHLALVTSLAGCAYITDEDEKWRIDPDGDDVPVGEDCDDGDAALAALVTWYVDADGDGYGAPGTGVSGCEAPSGTADNGADCDDEDGSVFPGAPEEWYDGVDSDCAGDDDYDQDGDGYTNDIDCDDEDPSRAPDAGVEETYFNGVDDNCDNTDQDGDKDGDSFWAVDYGDRVRAAGGTPLPIPDGLAGDCWDDDALLPSEQVVIEGFSTLDAADVHPGAAETWYDAADQDCGGIDANADGVVDDFDQDNDSHASLLHPDRDGVTGFDCNDLDPAVHPDAIEVWYDGVDADCGGEDDFDADGDLYQAAGHGGDDCADMDATVNPGAFDFWYDGVDQDCGGEDDYDADGDGDQSADWGGYDCDDQDAGRSSLEPETWYDGVDSDCSGGSDYDADGDGYDSSDAAAGGLDCDDDNSAANPGMTEVCGNGFDDDCDGSGAVAGGSCWIEGTLSVSSGETVIFSMGSSTQLGAVVSTGADVDSDGNDDWAFGAPAGGTGGLVHFDGIPTSGVYTTTSFGGGVTSNVAGDQLGSSVVLGDFNNDGVGDLFAGAPGQDDSAGEAGAGYLFFGPLVGGRARLSSSADAFIFGVSTNESFGTRATGLGDQDGDGAVDLAVASRANSYAGEVTVVSGITSSVSASAGSLPQLSGSSPLDKFGDALDGGGDVDGDGIQDLLVGAPASDPGGIPSAGSAVLYYGPLTVSGTAGDGVSFTGDATADYVGASVSIGGDVDGDGYDDLLIGSTGGGTSGSAHDGGAYLVHGPASSGGVVGVVAAASLGSPASGAGCGSSVDSGGDLDGDGRADVLIGCSSASVLTTGGGGVYVVYDSPSGALDLASEATAIIAGTASGESASVPHGVPDINADGYDELLVGAPDYASVHPDAGRAGLFLGGSW